MNVQLKRIYTQGGLLAVLRKIFEVFYRLLTNAIKNIYFKIAPSGAFYFNGNKLKYFRHNYNLAYENERTVEVAIVTWFLEGLNKGSTILEVGNVLRNYGIKRTRDILDKYDVSPGILNEDVVSFSPKKKYNAIVSISTLEHVGWDEQIRDPEKIPVAIKNLKDNCLAPGGIMLITLPLGYNTYFDEYIQNGGGIFSEKYFLKRISADNKWKQVEYSEVIGSKFGEPFNNANVMLIGVVRS